MDSKVSCRTSNSDPGTEGKIPCMLPSTKCQPFQACTHHIVLSTFRILLPHPGKTKPIKLTCILINSIIPVYANYWCHDVRTLWDGNAIRKGKVFDRKTRISNFPLVSLRVDTLEVR